MRPEITRERIRTGAFPRPEPRPLARLSVIGGRASTWQSPRGYDDDGFEPTIVRGRE